MTKKIVYVVPENFTGFINVIEDPTAEEELTLSSNEIRVLVPDSGRVIVDSIKVLRNWSSLSAVYSSGGSLPVRLSGDSEDKGFAFWILGAPAGKRLYFFVGTFEEVDSFIEANMTSIYSSPPTDPKP